MPKRQDPPPPTRVLIDADASMPAVLTEVRRHVDEAIVLVVPDQCPVLLTVAEFRALKDTAERAGVQLTIESNVSLRNQLASMFGIRTTSETAAAKGGWRPPDTLLGNTRAYDTWVQQPEDEQPRKRKRRVDPGHVDREESHRPKGNGTGSLDYIELDTDSDPAIGATARKIGKILAVVVTIALIATVAGWYALPNVTIVATPKTTSVSAEVNYAVAADGAGLPSDIAFTAPATAAEADVPYTITVKTTGVKRTPQETAHGEVILRNPTGEDVTVPAGTTLSIHAGASYTTDSEVTVPAASNNLSGETTVQVTATEAGTGGNAEPGILTGVIADLGVYYSNRDGAIEGGTDIEEPIVAEADITALEDKLVNDYTKAAAAGWNSQLPDGQSVVEPSVSATKPQDQPTAQVGDSAEEISVSGTVHATGLIYDQNEVDRLTTEYFQKSLEAQVPEGYAIDPKSVVLDAPLALASSPDNVQFRVSATATAYAVLSDAELNDIRSDIAGASWNDAHARLDQVEQWQSYELTISPGWWFKRMPRDDGRIDVQIVDLSQATPTPDASPGD